jgi:hypothetical protein
MGGGETSDPDHDSAELGNERFLKPRPYAASSEYGNQHRAFIDKNLECSLLANVKAAAKASFARKTLYMLPSHRPTLEHHKPTPRPQPIPEPPPRVHADPKKPKPKNHDKNAWWCNSLVTTPRSATTVPITCVPRAEKSVRVERIRLERANSRLNPSKDVHTFHRRPLALTFQQRHLHARRNNSTLWNASSQTSRSHARGGVTDASCRFQE